MLGSYYPPPMGMMTQPPAFAQGLFQNPYAAALGAPTATAAAAAYSALLGQQQSMQQQQMFSYMMAMQQSGAMRF